MKYFIVLLAVVAFVSAAEEKKAKEEKKEEKKPEERGGLQWPLPDPSSEGDLMLHGAEIYDRVDDLHKAKVEDEADKSVLAHGREFLRRVAKWFDDNADLKIIPVICQDTRSLNGSVSRWRLEIAKDGKASPVDAPPAAVQRDQPLPKDEKEEKPKKEGDVAKPTESPKVENATHGDNETISNATTTAAPIIQNDAPPASKPTERPTERPANSTDRPDNSTDVTPRPGDESYENRRRDFYRQVGSNFVRLIQRQWRKEALKADESEYLNRWLADEAVHYGGAAIYCQHGENVKEIRKQLAAFLEEKP